MTKGNVPPWWAHVVMAIFIATGFAAVPFWTQGLATEIAAIIAAIIFPAIVVVYLWMMRRR